MDSSSVPQIPKSSGNPSETALDEKRLGDGEAFWKEFVFLVNVREGMTKRLRDIAARNGTVKVFVDGPYGPIPDTQTFNTMVLIAGGSGISYTLPVMLDTIERVRNGTSNCRRILFIWSIRDASHIEWISVPLGKALQIAPSSISINIRIYITSLTTGSLGGNTGDWDDDSTQGSAENERDALSILELPSVTLGEGRPDLRVLLHEEIDTMNGRISVHVCGSPGIAQATRDALVFLRS